jgi:voltage-dependent potassium channel beta subunit
MSATMPYRHLGRAGVRVSLLSLGSWVTFGTQVDEEAAAACLQAAYEGGVNFFDNAESYAGGESERLMGRAFRALGWPRHSYLVSTKFYWGIHEGVNTSNTLNRKYLLQAIEGSLERLGLDFVDVVFCHRYDPETPVAEVVETMTDILERGQALYWGTSEWPAAALREAFAVAERHHLRAPVTEQPQYNLFARERVEQEYAPLCDEHGLGLTTWSPLASGLLSGKYVEGLPAGSRATLPGYEWLRDYLTDPERNAKVRRLVEIARALDCTPAQLAIAWCARNPRVSTVITGASTPEQVRENLRALEVLERLDAATTRRVEEALA